MRTTALQFAALAVLGLAFTGCSGGGSAARLEVRDGVAVCLFKESGREVKVGPVTDGQVALYNSWGGGTLALDDLEAAVAGIADFEGEGSNVDWHDERRSLYHAILSPRLTGIWQLESASEGDSVQQKGDRDPTWLIVRDDGTFRIVKTGRKPQGTWLLNESSQFVMNADNDDSKMAGVSLQPGDILELTVNEDGSDVTLRYVLTDLTEEPKAADE